MTRVAALELSIKAMYGTPLLNARFILAQAVAPVLPTSDQVPPEYAITRALLLEKSAKAMKGAPLLKARLTLQASAPVEPTSDQVPPEYAMTRTRAALEL